MSGEFARRLVRRIVVVAMTGGVITAAVFTVGLAAQWRAESAPLDVAPVGLTQLDADLAAEVTRSSDLTGQIADVAGQVATLRGALLAAGDTVASHTGDAQALQAKLDKATAKLARLQDQLKGAQRRLAALNSAAARQAALNRAAPRSGSSTSSGGGTPAGGGGEPNDD